jgi:hypothetical protein
LTTARTQYRGPGPHVRLGPLAYAAPEVFTSSAVTPTVEHPAGRSPRGTRSQRTDGNDGRLGAGFRVGLLAGAGVVGLAVGSPNGASEAPEHPTSTADAMRQPAAAVVARINVPPFVEPPGLPSLAHTRPRCPASTGLAGLDTHEGPDQGSAWASTPSIGTACTQYGCRQYGCRQYCS